jgi:hypothetical protein
MHSIYEHPVLGKSSEEVSDTGVAAYMLPLFPDISYNLFVAMSLLLQAALNNGNNLSFLGAFAKLRKATISFAMSALPSV